MDYPIDDERNRLNNEIIFRWMKKYTNPYEWFLEISGGEPGLYPKISELIQELCRMGYYGIIRTNGTLPIPKTETFIRLAGWHKQTSLETPSALLRLYAYNKKSQGLLAGKSRILSRTKYSLQMYRI